MSEIWKVYRKKPVAVKARRWHGSSFGKYDRMGRYRNHKIGVDAYGVHHTVSECGIPTPEGFMRLRKGDWLIIGTRGELYPCKPEMFKDCYEPA